MKVTMAHKRDTKADNPPSQISSNCLLPVTAVTPAQCAAHRNFKESIRTLKLSLVRSIFYLRTIKEHGIHRILGYRTIVDYARQEAGLGRRQCEAFLALGRKLPDLPQIARHLESGTLTWRQAQEIGRVANDETSAAWIEAATKMSVRELEVAVRRARAEQAAPPTPDNDNSAASEQTDPETSPDEPKPGVRLSSGPAAKSIIKAAPAALDASPADTPLYITLKLTPEQFAIWEHWLALANRERRGATKEELLCGALEGTAGTGAPILRLVIHNCPECDRAHLITSRGNFETPSALLDRAKCDGEIQQADGGLRRIVPPRMKRSVLARDGHRCRAEGCRHTQHLQIHHIVPTSAGGKTEPGNLVTLCSRCHCLLHEGERELQDILRHAP